MIASRGVDCKIPILCIIGPTAAGKTARGAAEATARGGEIISVDSRQVYRGLDIGTEKAAMKERGGIPHHLIDIRNPEEYYSAGEFVADANQLITDIHARGKLPILVGGTHFYFDALLNGLPDEVPKNSTLRYELEKLSDEELMERVRAADSRRACELDPKNRRRLIRALEIINVLGRVPPRPTGRAEGAPGGAGLVPEWIIIDPPKEILRARIDTRLKETLSNGLIEEVRNVRERVGDIRLNELGLEYRIIGEYLRKERDEKSLFPALSAKLWQYARHQKAWLRKLAQEYQITKDTSLPRSAGEAR